MSHGAFIRPSGVWAANSVVTHAEMAAFDLAQYKAITEDGGIWNPSTTIRLGGAGLSVTGPFAASGDFDVSSEAAEFAGTEISLSGGAAIVVEGTGAIAIQDNARIDLTGTGAINVGNLSVVDFASGSYLKIESGANFLVRSGATQTIQSGGAVAFQGTAAETFASGTSATFASGSTLTASPGSAVIAEADDVILTGTGDPHYGTARAFSGITVPHAAMPGSGDVGVDNAGYNLVSTGSSLGLVLHFPRSATITRLELAIACSSASWPVGTVPKLELYATAAGSLSASLVGSYNDAAATASLAAYNATHALFLDESLGTLPSGGFVVNNSTTYVLVVTGDTGNILRLGAPRMTGTLPKLRLV